MPVRPGKHTPALRGLGTNWVDTNFFPAITRVLQLHLRPNTGGACPVYAGSSFGPVSGFGAKVRGSTVRRFDTAGARAAPCLSRARTQGWQYVLPKLTIEIAGEFAWHWARQTPERQTGVVRANGPTKPLGRPRVSFRSDPVLDSGRGQRPLGGRLMRSPQNRGRHSRTLVYLSLSSVIVCRAVRCAVVAADKATVFITLTV